jgi:hypothetical protein
MVRSPLAALPFVFAGFASVACVDDANDAGAPLQLLQANVGTALLSCDAYVFKLCDAAAEGAIARALAASDADVVALQEVLPDRVCDAIDATGGEGDARRTCHPDVRATQPTQLSRLLPDDVWDTACDARNGFECVGVRRGRARLVSDYVTAPDVVDVDACDPGFTVGRADVALDEVVVRVVNAHPQSTKDTCRKAQVEQLFGPLTTDDAGAVDAVVVTGDMNLDPFGLGLDADDVSVPVWSSHVGKEGDGLAFSYASGPAEREPPYPTTTALVTATFDHVAVKGGRGTCTTLGAAPGTQALDDDRAAMDHRALDCSLVLGGSEDR